MIVCESVKDIYDVSNKLHACAWGKVYEQKDLDTLSYDLLGKMTNHFEVIQYLGRKIAVMIFLMTNSRNTQWSFFCASINEHNKLERLNQDHENIILSVFLGKDHKTQDIENFPGKYYYKNI